ncbi:MAG: hypothetical protein ACLQD8_00315 [Thermoplasmata archaeon]
MANVPLLDIETLGRRLAGERFDEFSGRVLGRAYEEFIARRSAVLGALELRVDGKEFATFYEALADPEALFTEGEIRVTGAPAPGPEWAYLAPFERISFHPDGSAELHPPGDAPPRRAIARVLLREHFVPRSRVEEDRAAAGGAHIQLPTRIGTLAQGMMICRVQPVLPFSVALLLYLAEERVRYELDIVRRSLLADPRAGRLSTARRVARPSRLSWSLDRTIGRGDSSLLATRCLEVLAESNGLSSIELAHVFGGVRELVDSALQGVVQRQLVAYDRRTGIYRVRLESFLPEAENRPPPDETKEVGGRALRTSVQELIAAADAQAACPLCGRRFPPGPTSLLCNDCTALVGMA